MKLIVIIMDIIKNDIIIIVIVIMIIIEAVCVEQDHGVVGDLQTWIQTLQHQSQINLQKATG